MYTYNHYFVWYSASTGRPPVIYSSGALRDFLEWVCWGFANILLVSLEYKHKPLLHSVPVYTCFQLENTIYVCDTVRLGTSGGRCGGTREKGWVDMPLYHTPLDNTTLCEFGFSSVRFTVLSPFVSSHDPLLRMNWLSPSEEIPSQNVSAVLCCPLRTVSISVAFLCV